jgi:hypothetical protein
MSCECGIKDLKPLGSPACKFNFEQIRAAIFVEKSYSSDPTNYTAGILNIFSDTTLFFTGKAAITPKLFNVETVKEAPVTQTFDDGTVVFIRDGVRPFNALMLKPTPQQTAAFNELRCKNVGVYLVDKNGTILGYSRSVTPTTFNLHPIPIDSQTVSSIFQFATDASATTGSVNFQFSEFVKDANLFAAEPTFDILELVENTPIPVHQTSLATIDLANLQIDLSLSFNTWEFSNTNESGEFTPQDFLTSFTIVVSNKTTGNDVTFNGCNVDNITSGVELEISYTSITGVISIGDNYVIKLINGLKLPFSKLIFDTGKFLATNVVV